VTLELNRNNLIEPPVRRDQRNAGLPGHGGSFWNQPLDWARWNTRVRHAREMYSSWFGAPAAGLV